MFNAKRTFGFWGRVLKVLLPPVLPIVILAVLTAYLTRSLVPFANFLGQSALNIVLYVGAYALAVVAILVFAGRFAAAVYGLGGTRAGMQTVIRLLFGKPGFGPFAMVSGGQMTSGQDGIVNKVGGPAGLIIHNDSAVVLEKRGKLSRVVGPGLPVLEPFEKIYDIIDLRPKRWSLSVNAMTKEGIPVTWDVEIHYQIDDGGSEPSDENPYPFSAEAVFKAATGKWRREAGRVQEMDWEGWIVVSQTEGTLRSIIARRSLDELISLTEAESLAVRESVQQELTGIIREAAPKIGAKLLDIRLQSLKVEDEITTQWIEAWKARWQGWSTRQLAPKEADRIQEYEKAKAKAHILPLNNLTAELQKLDHADQAVILMRLSSILDQGAMGVASRVFFPGQALETVEHIRDIFRTKEYPGPEGRNGTVKIDVLESGAEAETVYPREIIRVLPLFDEVAAGQEKPVLDDVQGYVQQFDEYQFELDGHLLEATSLRGQKWLSFSKEASYMVIKIAGDSMDQAGITPADYVILQRKGVGSLVPATGDIVTVVFRDEDCKTTLKRITIRSDSITLKPESSNPSHEVRTLSYEVFKGDPPTVEITGIAIAVLKLKEAQAFSFDGI